MDILIFLAITFVISYIVGYLFNKIKLPKLLGYLLVGLLVGNLFDFNDLITDDLISIITSFALAVILIKAGLGIERAIIKKIGFRVLLLGTIPNIIEGIIIAILSILVFDFGVLEAFMLGFIISAVSPAVVIPSMTRLMDKGYNKEITTLGLAATSFDDVVSLTIFSVFLSIYLGTGDPTTLIILAPIKIMFGGILGAMLGYGLGKLYKATLCLRYQIIQFLIVITIAVILKQYGEMIFIIEMISIMTLGYFINDTNKDVGVYLKRHTNKIWNIAQVFLFFMIGFLADISEIGEYLWIGILLIIVGLTGRAVGVLISLYKSGYDKKLQSFTMISNLPKATVQAVLGAVPLSKGVTNGNIILSLSVLAIIFTAPIGLLLIEYFGPRLLKKDTIE